MAWGRRCPCGDRCSPVTEPVTEHVGCSLHVGPQLGWMSCYPSCARGPPSDHEGLAVRCGRRRLSDWPQHSVLLQLLSLGGRQRPQATPSSGSSPTPGWPCLMGDFSRQYWGGIPPSWGRRCTGHGPCPERLDGPGARFSVLRMGLVKAVVPPLAREAWGGSGVGSGPSPHPSDLWVLPSRAWSSGPGEDGNQPPRL